MLQQTNGKKLELGSLPRHSRADEVFPREFNYNSTKIILSNFPNFNYNPKIL